MLLDNLDELGWVVLPGVAAGYPEVVFLVLAACEDDVITDTSFVLPGGYIDDGEVLSWRGELGDALMFLDVAHLKDDILAGTGPVEVLGLEELTTLGLTDGGQDFHSESLGPDTVGVIRDWPEGILGGADFHTVILVLVLSDIVNKVVGSPPGSCVICRR